MDRQIQVIEQVTQSMEMREAIIHAIYENFKKVIFNRQSIRNVVFGEKETVVYWNDDTETHVESADMEAGLTKAILKKMCGNDERYRDIYREWIPGYNYESAEQLLPITGE